MEFKLLENYSCADEWIVEKMNKDNKMSVVGKIFVPSPTIHLNNQQLEIIWDLLNWGPAGYDLSIIDTECIYKGYKAIDSCVNGVRNQLVLIPIGIDHCNDTIFIRKYYDSLPTDFGYWIKRVQDNNNNHRLEKDKWVYTTREIFQEYMKQYHFK